MDETFAKTVSDATSDTWKLKTVPSSLTSVSAEEYIKNFKFMSISMKIRLLLQLSLICKDYRVKNESGIQEFVQLCANDEEEWVSKCSQILFSTEKEGKGEGKEAGFEFTQRAVSAIQSNPLFDQPAPPFLHSSPHTLEDWKQVSQRSSLPKPIQITLRNPDEVPTVTGRAGNLRKRNRAESINPQETNEVKKSKKHSLEKLKNTSVIRIQVPVATHVASSSTTGSSSSISVEEKNKSREKKKAKPKSAPVVDKTPVPGDSVDVLSNGEKQVKDIEPLKTASDEPFVALAPERQAALAVENSWRKLAEKFPIPAVKTNKMDYHFESLFVNMLRSLAYDGVQEEGNDVLKAFMRGELPKNCEWREGGEDEMEVDLVVGIKENPCSIRVLRLCFADFSWELIEFSSQK